MKSEERREKNLMEYVGKHKMKLPSIPPKGKIAPSNSHKGGESKGAYDVTSTLLGD